MTQMLTKPAQPAAAAPVAVRKFRAGVQKHQEPTDTVTAVPSATSTTQFQKDIPAYGFLRKIWLLIAVTGGAAAGTNAVYKEDAPYSWLSVLQILDVNSAAITFQITGLEAAMMAKYGGYATAGDPKSGPTYSQGGAGGNSVFVLPLHLEIRSRDCVGALPNKNNATSYKVSGTIAATTDVFSTAPGTLPTLLTMKIVMDCWWEPEAVDLKGRPQAQMPPALDTTQYLSKQIIAHNSGAVTHRLARVGQYIRNLVLIQRDATPVRSSTTFPDPLTVVYEGQNMTMPPQALIRHEMAQKYGYVNTVDTAGGLDTGVFVLDFNQDFGTRPGEEQGNAWLPTTSATRLELQGSAGSAGTLVVLTNDVSVKDDVLVAGM